MYKYIENNIGLSAFSVVYAKGSDFESIGKRGTSHLMEHLMCKTFDDHRKTLRRFGIKYNALTGNDRIIFYFKGLDEKMKQVSQTLLDCITNPTKLWTEEEFNIEKQIVLQEYSDTFNDVVGGSLMNLLREYYGVCYPIGFKEDIESFTFEDSLKEAESFQNPLGVCEVGKKNLDFNLDFSVEPEPAFVPKFGNYVKPEVCATGSKSLIGLLSNKTIPYDQVVKNRLSFVISCLNGDLESPLYKIIREERGLSYFSALDALPISNQIAVLAFATTDNPKELIQTYEEFFDGDLSRHLSLETFEVVRDLVLVNKRKLEIFPQSRVKSEFSSDPFAGLEDFTHKEAVAMLGHFKSDNFVLINK